MLVVKLEFEDSLFGQLTFRFIHTHKKKKSKNEENKSEKVSLTRVSLFRFEQVSYTSKRNPLIRDQICANLRWASTRVSLFDFDLGLYLDLN